MKRFRSFLMIVLVLAAGIAIGFALGKWGTNTGAMDNDDTGDNTAPGIQGVLTTPIRQGPITQTIQIYGSVVAAPGAQKSLSVNFESRVVNIYAFKGQTVYSNQPLLEVQASEPEMLNLVQAENEVKTAAAQMEQVNEKLQLQLATKQDFIAAQDALNAAKLKLQSMQEMGIGSPVILRAATESLVVDMPVSLGQINSASAPLIDLLPKNKTLVELNVLPTDARELKPSQEVGILVITQDTPLTVAGTISMISSQIDPGSGFVDIYVLPDDPSKLMLGQYVSCELQTASNVGLIVPREAVLPDDDQEDMYTVNDSHAVLHHVKIGLSNDQQIEVFAPDIHAGDPVVIMGNAELSDGMAVKQENQP